MKSCRAIGKLPPLLFPLIAVVLMAVHSAPAQTGSRTASAPGQNSGTANDEKEDEKEKGPRIKSPGSGASQASKSEALAAIEAMLLEAKRSLDGGESSEAVARRFFGELGALSERLGIETPMPVVNEAKGNLLKTGRAAEALGAPLGKGGTPVERCLLSYRKDVTLECIKRAIAEVTRALGAENMGKVFLVKIGKWATQDPDMLMFAGDIDFTFLASDPEVGLALRDSFNRQMQDMTRLNMVQIDSVATAHGRATHHVYVGPQGQKYGDDEMMKLGGGVEQINFFDLDAPPRTVGGQQALIEVLIAGVEAEYDRLGLAEKGRSLAMEIERAWNDRRTMTVEPFLSMEMGRHLEGDIISRVDTFTAIDIVKKGSKYLRRSNDIFRADMAKAMDAQVPTAPTAANMDQASWATFAVEVDERAKKSSSSDLAKFIHDRLKQMGAADLFRLEGGEGSWNLVADEGTAMKFLNRAKELIWKNVETGLDVRIRSLTQMMNDPFRVHIGEGGRRQGQQLADLIRMMDAGLKAMGEEHSKIPEPIVEKMRILAKLIESHARRMAFSLPAEELDRVREALKQTVDVEDGLLLRTAAVIDRVDKFAVAQYERLKLEGTLGDAYSLADAKIDAINNVVDWLDNTTLGELREKGILKLQNYDEEGRPVDLFVAEFPSIAAINQRLNASLLGKVGNNTAFKAFNLVQESSAYYRIMTESDTAGELVSDLAAEVFRRRVPGGGALEAVALGNYGRACVELTYLLFPPLAIPEALVGMGTAVYEAAVSAWWSDALTQFTDQLYVDSHFDYDIDLPELKRWRFASVDYNNANWRRDYLESGRPAFLDDENLNEILKNNFYDLDPLLSCYEELKKHPSAGDKVRDHFERLRAARWMQVKADFVRRMILQLEARKNAESIVGEGKAEVRLEQLMKLAAELDIAEKMERLLGEESGSSYFSGILTWLRNRESARVGLPPSESEAAKAAETVERYLDVYQRVFDARTHLEDSVAAWFEKAERKVTTGHLVRHNQRILTGITFLEVSPETDRKRADYWSEMPGVLRERASLELKRIKQRYLKNADLDESGFDQLILAQLTFEDLWILALDKIQVAGVSERSFQSARGEHRVERIRLLDEFEKYYSRGSGNLLYVEVFQSDAAQASRTPVRHARVVVTGANGEPIPLEEDRPGEYRRAGLVSGPYELEVSAPGFLNKRGEPIDRRRIDSPDVRLVSVELVLKESVNGSLPIELTVDPDLELLRNVGDSSTVKLEAKVSPYPDSGTIRYQWAANGELFTPDGVTDLAVFDATGRDPGTVTITLLTFDERGREGFAERIFEVLPGGPLPVRIEDHPAEIPGKGGITIKVAEPYGPDGTYRYEWKLNGRPMTEFLNFTKFELYADKYPDQTVTLELIVSSSDGRTGKVASRIRVLGSEPPAPPSEPLRLSLQLGRNPISEGETVGLRAVAGGGAAPFELSWKGQGVSGLGETAIFSGARPGDHPVSVVVRDSEGNEEAAEVIVSVKAAPSAGPDTPAPGETPDKPGDAKPGTQTGATTTGIKPTTPPVSTPPAGPDAVTPGGGAAGVAKGYGFEVTIPGSWSRVDGRNLLHLSRQRAVWNRGQAGTSSVSGSFMAHFQPGERRTPDEILRSLQLAEANRPTGNVSPDMAVGLNKHQDGAISSLSLGEYRGHLLEYPLYMRRGTGNPLSGYTGSYLGRSGLGIAAGPEGVITFSFDVPGAGAWDNSDWAFLIPQVKAGSAEGASIGRSLRLVAKEVIHSVPYTGPALDGGDIQPLEVSLSGSTETMRPSQIRDIKAIVKGGTPPYLYDWEGDHAGAGESVTFIASKGGEYRLKVTVTDDTKAVASSEITLKVEAPEFAIEGLQSREIYASTRKIFTRLVAGTFPAASGGGGINPPKEIAPGSGYIFPVDEEGTPEPPPLRYLFHATEPGVEFDPPESSDGSTDVLFGRMGPLKIWAQVVDAAGQLVGETEQVPFEVIAPAFQVRYDPPSGKVGREVRATVDIAKVGEFDLPADRFLFEWETPISADRMEYADNGGVIGFTPKKVDPVPLAAVIRVPHYRDEIGRIESSFAATGYTVKAELVETGVRSKVFDPVRKEFIQPPRGAYMTDELIHLKATVEGEPAPEGVRYEWSVNPGTSISNGFSSTPTVSRHENGAVTATVRAWARDEVYLGEATVSASVMFTPDPVNPLIVSISSESNALKSGSSMKLTASVAGGTPPYSQAWLGVTQSSGASATATGGKPGLQTVSVEVTDSTGKKASARTSWTVEPAELKIEFKPDRSRLMIGDTVRLNPVVTGGAPPYEWSWEPDEIIGSGAAASYTAVKSGEVAIKGNVVDAMGNVGSGSIILAVDPVNARITGIDGSLMPGDKRTIQVETSLPLPREVTFRSNVPGVRFIPSNKDGQVTALFEKAGTYTLTAEVRRWSGTSPVLMATTEPLTVSVESPSFTMSFVPESAPVGAEVRAVVQMQGARRVADSTWKVNWQSGPSVRSEISSPHVFRPEDTRPLTMSAFIESADGSVIIGRADGTFQPVPLILPITSQPPSGEIEVGKSVTLTARVESDLPGSPVFEWNLENAVSAVRETGPTVSLSPKLEGLVKASVIARTPTGGEIGRGEWSAAAKGSPMNDPSLTNRFNELIKAGYAKETGGDLIGAIASYEAAVAIIPEERVNAHIAELRVLADRQRQAQELVNRGYGHEQAGRIPGAISDYEAALALVPDNRLSAHVADLKSKDTIMTPATGPASPANVPPAGELPAPPKVIVATGNAGAVENGPTAPATFDIDQAWKITEIETYHWNNGRGKTPGTIALRHQDGTLLGPWKSGGREGQGGVPNAYWIATPNEILKPGTYTVVDSDPSTWATNAEGGGKGFFRIQGSPVGSTEPTPAEPGMPPGSAPTPPVIITGKTAADVLLDWAKNHGPGTWDWSSKGAPESTTQVPPPPAGGAAVGGPAERITLHVSAVNQSNQPVHLIVSGFGEKPGPDNRVESGGSRNFSSALSYRKEIHFEAWRSGNIIARATWAPIPGTKGKSLSLIYTAEGELKVQP